MEENDMLNLFTKSTIKAYDGMPVTAEIWDVAHAEHRNDLRAHNVMMHGAGIKSGLEVKANDPADHYVFISPGVAVDTLGRVIVVDQTIAYDFGDDGEGTYILFLGYGEHEVEDTTLSVKKNQHEYIVAARENLPKQPVVELARVVLQKKDSVIRNAGNIYNPEPGELDLRYRQDKPWVRGKLCIGIMALGDLNDNVREAWRVMRQSLPYMLSIDIDVVDVLSNDEDLDRFDIIHLYLSGVQSLDGGHSALVQKLLNSGKGLLLEGLDDGGFEALKQTTLKGGMKKVDALRSPLFNQPFFFRQPPAGITEEHLYTCAKTVLCGDKTTQRWSGMIEDKPLTRGEIRDYLEWGVNILLYCAK